ncbi:uncharacterized protein LOC129593596 [Paramacrobiotus metropolitanus]|uniref:uncharacterized protein LOC129593596 n=1 Tax=Paramacrobiotus metropolitanus TaxID=2943436 RepID=UPI0024460183|nr:uncharacterized protein LOC129593596 [Paramacrobiotus metropolitanus]
MLETQNIMGSIILLLCLCWAVTTANDQLCRKFHIIQKSDTPASIARHYGFTEKELLANELFYGGMSSFVAGRMVCVAKDVPEQNCRIAGGNDSLDEKLIRQQALIRIDLVSPKSSAQGLGLDKDDPYGFCSGVLISRDVVLTSMTCLIVHTCLPGLNGIECKIPVPQNYQVGLYAGAEENSYRLSYRKVTKIISHPQFDPAQRANDLGLVVMEQTANGSANNGALVAKMPKEGDLPVCQQSIVTMGAWDGLGVANYTLDGFLLQVDKRNIVVPWKWKLLDNKLCKPLLHMVVGKNGWGGEQDTLMCADSGNTLHETNICVSSNGAPFYAYDSNSQDFTLTGILTWTNRCWNGQVPLVDVKKHISWINQNI